MRVVLVVLLTIINLIECKVQYTKTEIYVQTGASTQVQVESTSDLQDNNLTIHFFVQHEDIVGITPRNLTINPQGNSTGLEITGRKAGKSDVYGIFTSEFSDYVRRPLILVVNVYKDEIVFWLSEIVGWVYLMAWTVCFYPQIYLNYKNKSVDGLSFDANLLCAIGFSASTIFNIGLYYIPLIQNEYYARYPRSVIPVPLNDVVFSLYSDLLLLIVTYQFCIYTRLKLSLTIKITILLYILLIIICIILAILNYILWLDFLNLCSFCKIYGSMAFYIPQICLNYKLKSTKGYSTSGNLLDFTGGCFSLLQLLLGCYNYNDWNGIAGNPTKFIVGAITLFFTTVIIIQSLILYRNPKVKN